MLTYTATLSCAKQYAEAGKIEEWVHAYLLSDGNNKEFSDGLKLFDRYFIGPLPCPCPYFPVVAVPRKTCGIKSPKSGLKST